MSNELVERLLRDWTKEWYPLGSKTSQGEMTESLQARMADGIVNTLLPLLTAHIAEREAAVREECAIAMEKYAARVTGLQQHRIHENPGPHSIIRSLSPSHAATLARIRLEEARTICADMCECDADGSGIVGLSDRISKRIAELTRQVEGK